MLRLAADENFNADIVRGLLRRLPGLDIVRVQDAGLSGSDDPAVLEWAAREGRIVLTHDISTLVSFAFERMASARPNFRRGFSVVEPYAGPHDGDAWLEVGYCLRYGIGTRRDLRICRCRGGVLAGRLGRTTTVRCIVAPARGPLGRVERTGPTQ